MDQTDLFSSYLRPRYPCTRLNTLKRANMVHILCGSYGKKPTLTVCRVVCISGNLLRITFKLGGELLKIRLIISKSQFLLLALEKMGRRTNLLYEHELYQSKVKIKKTQIEIFFVKQDSPRRNM